LYIKIKNSLRKIKFFYLLYRRYIFPFFLNSDPNIRLIRKLRFENSIDIGANVGVYSMELSNVSNKVYAFEPLASEYNKIKYYKYDNIALFNFALGSENSVRKINIPINDNVPECLLVSLEQNFFNQKSIKIKVKKFDSLKKFQNLKIDFVKIDVEGYEFKVLLGMKKLISKLKPIFLVEIEKRHSKDYLKVFKMFQKNNYMPYHTANGNGLIKFKIKTFSKIKYSYMFNKTNRLKYINNFWFIHIDSLNKKEISDIFN